MRITDGLSGLVFILLGLTMIVIAAGFPDFPGQPYGADLLPTLLGMGLILAGAGLAVRDALARRASAQRAPLASLDDDLRSPRALLAVAAVLGLVVGQILLGRSIGYLPVSVVGLAILLLVLGIRPVLAVAVAIATTIACWWVFVDVLRVPLPRGLLNGVL